MHIFCPIHTCPVACVCGDAHLVMLDGYKYTFNGKGEFTLVGLKDVRVGQKY